MIARIDGLGGTLAAIESGFIQREIQDAAYQAQQRIDSGESVVVGVNRLRSSVDETGGQATSTTAARTIDPDDGGAPDRARPPGARVARPGRVAGGPRRRVGRGARDR